MRDIVITLLIFSTIPYILSRAHTGVLVWSWLGYMNPHRLTWGFAYSFPFAQLIAICTLFSLLYCRERQKIPLTGLTVLWFLFIAWMIITTQYAIMSNLAFEHLDKVMKIHLIALLTIVLITSRERLNQLIWVIVLSVGYYGVKGGFFSIITGGAHRVWGPPNSNLYSNNQLAAALLMILPLTYYLYQQAEHRWLKRALLVSMPLMAFAVAGSHSRGALLAGLAMVGYLWLKSKKKWITGAAMLLLLPTILLFMPSHWHERMATIQTYEEDASAVGRLEAWEFAVNIANQRLTGGGFRIWRSQPSFDRYAPGYDARAAHSIFFGVMGDQGWPGFLLFMGIGILSFSNAGRIIRRTRPHPKAHWMGELARMLQVSIVAYAVGGAFLSLSYFDLFWHVVAMVVILRLLMERQLAVNEASAIPVTPPTAERTPPNHPVGLPIPQHSPLAYVYQTPGQRRSLWKE